MTKCKEQFPTADKVFGVKKIHAFRCSFRRELKKVIDSQKSGTPADNVYVPTLWYYDLLSFVADSEIPKEESRIWTWSTLHMMEIRRKWTVPK